MLAYPVRMGPAPARAAPAKEAMQTGGVIMESIA